MSNKNNFSDETIKNLELNREIASIAKLHSQNAEILENILKLQAETCKIKMETVKIKKESFFYPFVVCSSFASALIGISIVVTKLFL